jgi:hypothetical protein
VALPDIGPNVARVDHASVDRGYDDRRGGEMKAIAFMILLAVCGGCRTYNVYMLPCGDATITVDAQVDKEINPNVKASLK